MLLQPLPQRRCLGDLLAFAEIRLDAGRRLGWRRTEQVLQDPLAAHHGGGACGDRGYRQHAAVTQQPAARAGGIEGDAAEVAAADVLHPVVTRQPLVNERVVGIEQLDDRPILTDDGAEEHLGFAAERLAQVVVEARRLGLDVSQLPQIQPLTGEVFDQRVGLRIGKHARHLALQGCRVAQAALARKLEQLVVRNAAPQEERQARRELEIADAVDAAGRNVRRLFLDAVDEARRDEHAGQRDLNAGLEVPRRAPLPVKRHQRVEVRAGHGAAVRAPRDRRQDVLRARLFFRRGRGPADEDATTAWRVAGTGWIERPHDVDALHAAAGGEAVVGRAEGRIGVVDAGAARAIDHGGANRVRAGLDGHAEASRVLGGDLLAVERDVGSAAGPATAAAADG